MSNKPSKIKPINFKFFPSCNTYRTKAQDEYFYAASIKELIKKIKDSRKLKVEDMELECIRVDANCDLINNEGEYIEKPEDVIYVDAFNCDDSYRNLFSDKSHTSERLEMELTELKLELQEIQNALGVYHKNKDWENINKLSTQAREKMDRVKVVTKQLQEAKLVS